MPFNVELKTVHTIQMGEAKQAWNISDKILKYVDGNLFVKFALHDKAFIRLIAQASGDASPIQHAVLLFAPDIWPSGPPDNAEYCPS